MDGTIAAMPAADMQVVDDEGEFRRGWQIVVASAFVFGCGLAALPFYTIGVFTPHLVREFGWSVGEIMTAMMITTVSVTAGGPAAGLLCERYGTRPVVLISLVLFGLSYMSLATIGNSLLRFYLTFAMISLMGAGTLPITFTRTINRWFDRRRGLALGLAMMGTGLFGILCKPLLAWVIGGWGWRTGFAVLGALPLVLALPIALVLFREPAAAPRPTVMDAATSAAPEDVPGMTRAEAVRSWRFWLMATILLLPREMPLVLHPVKLGRLVFMLVPIDPGLDLLVGGDVENVQFISGKFIAGLAVGPLTHDCPATARRGGLHQINQTRITGLYTPGDQRTRIRRPFDAGIGIRIGAVGA